MRALAVTLLLALPLAGCVAEAPLEPAAVDDALPAEATPVLAEPALVAEFARDAGGGWEFSACPMGEGPPVPRTGALVANGTRALRVTVEAGATTALRAGWQLDDGEPAWTDVVPAGQSRTFEVPVDASAWETGKERWTFLYQPNLPAPATQACYTGASVGGFRVAFEAMP